VVGLRGGGCQTLRKQYLHNKNEFLDNQNIFNQLLQKIQSYNSQFQEIKINKLIILLKDKDIIAKSNFIKQLMEQ